MKLINLIYSYLLIKNGYAIQIEGAEKDTSICTKPYMRKEIRDMSVLEVKQFITALREIKKRSNFWDSLVKIHIAADNYAHSKPIFLPYHRQLLRQMEIEIQKIYPNLYLPFWNWSKDSQNPEKSIVFTKAYFGGNGDESDYVVNTGPFAFEWVSWPVEGHLLRQFDNGDTISAFPAPEHLEVLLKDSATYEDFNLEISMDPHGAPHENIGGTFGHISSMSSPNDPLFWLHHCFIDMLWWNWQKRKGEEIGMGYGGNDADLHDPIIPWGVPVYKLLNTTSYGSCFIYPDFKVELPEAPKVNSTRRIVNLRSKKPLGGKGHKIEIDNEDGLHSLMGKISNGEIEGEQVHHNDRHKKGKIRSPKPLSPRIMKMFKIKPENAKKQAEKLDLVSQALNIAENFTPSSSLQEGNPEDLVSPELKKWAEQF